MDILFLIIGLAAGTAIGYLLARLSRGSDSQSAELQQHKVELATERSTRVRLEQELAAQRSELQSLREHYQQELRQGTEWKGKHDSLAEKLELQRSELEQLQQKFTRDFELIANKILDEKSSKFTEQNQKNLDTLLKPLKDRIGEFQQKVEETNEKNAVRSSALESQLKMLRELNQEITQETRSLTQALRGDSKTQGNWGEFHLESILEKAGLQKDVHYSKETNLKTEDGSNQRLDYIIHLPDGKHLILDSKVSLTAYSNYCDTDDENERAGFLRQHLDSINAHIKLLGQKDYQKLHSINTPDYVLMFIANEPALTLALKEDMGLFEKALDKNIVLVSASTLLATLRTISYIWKQDLQNRNAEEIARQAAGLYDKFASFSEDLIKLGKQMETATGTYEEAMKKLTSGKDNLIRKTERLKELGVNPSKHIDPRLVDRAGEDD